MIVVATENFEVYHEVVTALRDRGATFTSVRPGDPLPEETTGVVLGPGDRVDVPEDVSTVRAEPGEPRPAVEAVLRDGRTGDGRTVVGIDPGERPGIAVLVGDTVEAAFQVPAGQAADRVREELADAVDPLVRIGDGARLVGSRLIDDLPDVPVELVDETGTTPHLGAGTRRMGDVLAAVNIARREGERVSERRVEPTAGELTRIAERAREESETNSALTEGLARRVARGELSLEQAIAEHERE